MTYERGWRVFKTKNTGIPRVLVKSSLTSSGYTIYLTDLRRVWAEQLTKAQLVQRAVDNGCSIDPSGDESQYQKLQEKIQSVIENDESTTAALSLAPDDDDRLVLSLSAPLPSPLPNLKWDIYLHALPFDQVGSLLISPLLLCATRLQRKVQSLVTELHDKDRVISKITDRLESSGNDLTTVFPGTSNVKISRKRPQRDQLARHINGLAEFDEQHWNSRVDNEATSVDISEHTLNCIFGDMPNSSANSVSLSAANGWWRDLANERSEDDLLVTSTSNGVDASSSLTQAENEFESIIEDEFQRQSTPAAFRKDGTVAKSVESAPDISGTGDGHPTLPEDDSTAEEESDLDTGTQITLQLKGKAAEVPSLSPRSISRVQNYGKVSADPPEESNDGGLAPASSSEENLQEQTSVERPRHKLGKLGGISTQSAVIERSSILRPAKNLSTIGKDNETSVPSEPTERDVATTRKRRLGALGGKSKYTDSIDNASLDGYCGAETDDFTAGGKIQGAATGALIDSRMKIDTPDPDNDSRSRSRNVKKEEMSTPRETSKERADRKRHELKRGLEEKSRAPIKKKRKF